MSSRTARQYSHSRRGEKGVALVTTVLIVLIMGLLAGTALAAAGATASTASRDDSYSAALGAADAGVDDLLYRLNANEDTSFQLAENIYNYDQALILDPSTACPTTDSPEVPPAACGWVTMPDDGSASAVLQYEYQVPSNHPPVPSGAATTAGATGSSMLVFDVSGRAFSADGQIITRSVRVVLTRSTFLNYGYFTNVETQDPQQYDLLPNQPGWPEFGPDWGSGITAWNGAATQSSQPKNAYDAALDYCQNYWFEANPSPDETAQAATAGVTISQDPRSIHSETSNGYSLSNICTFTKWETGDTFYGPVRTNDVFFIDGTTNFYGPVIVGTPCNMLTSADPGASKSGCPTGVLGEGTAYTPDAANDDGDGVYWVDAHNILYGSPIAPNFSQPPSYAAPVNLPPGNSELEEQAAANGCLYEGMTYFNFLKNGDVYVYSPGSAAAVAAGTFTLNSGCSTNGDVVLSSHPVLYVEQASTTTGACLDSKGSDYTFGGLVQSNDYYTGNIAYSDTGGADSQWQYGSGAPNSLSSDPRAFACNNGDAWVGGVVSGSVTVGADNNIVVYQNLTYANSSYSISGDAVTSTGTDVLGLEPKNDVVVYHPVDCPSWDSNPATGNCITTNGNDANNDFSTSCPSGQATTWTYGGSALPADCIVNQIEGAILAFNGEYTAENYSLGASLGTLTEFGSVSQAYRGRLAGTSSGGGYGKQYVYDPRLATLTPPSFLPPGLFAWSEATWSEVSGQVQPITSNTEAVPTPPSAPTPTAPAYTVPPAAPTTTTTGPTTTTTTTTVPTTTTSSTTTTTTTTTVPTTTTTTVPTTTTTTHPTTTTSSTTTTTVPTTTTTHATTTTTTVPTSTTTTRPTTTTTTTVPTTTTTTTPRIAPTVSAATDYCYAGNEFYAYNSTTSNNVGSNPAQNPFNVTATGTPAPTLTAAFDVLNSGSQGGSSYFTFNSSGSSASVAGSGSGGGGATGPVILDGEVEVTVTATNSAGTATANYVIFTHGANNSCSYSPNPANPNPPIP
jgi:uncharacterized membrane protein YgcG